MFNYQNSISRLHTCIFITVVVCIYRQLGIIWKFKIVSLAVYMILLFMYGGVRNPIKLDGILKYFITR